MDNLVIYIESLIFAADQPITRSDVRYALENCFETQISPEEVDTAIEQLIDKYNADTFAMEVNEIGGGLQFMTKPAFHHVIGSHLKLITKKRLSRVALETLAIIAYKQPVTKTELEKIRGVSCDYALQKLLEKELVTIEGRAEGPGRPLMYATSPKFMDYLGLKDIKDLPKLRELEQTENSIGESAPVEIDEAPESEKDLSENGHTPESGSPEIQPTSSDVVNDTSAESEIDGEVVSDQDAATEVDVNMPVASEPDTVANSDSDAHVASDVEQQNVQEREMEVQSEIHPEKDDVIHDSEE